MATYILNHSNQEIQTYYRIFNFTIMKKFIFLTKEGYTEAPNDSIVIHNMQVIGIVDEVKNEDEALKKLLVENSWIFDAEFNVAEFIIYEIL